MTSEGSPFEALSQVRAYWEALCLNGLPPHRSQIDPRGIEGALSNAFLLERIASGMARFRIAGMHLTDLMGMEVRGMPLSALFDPSARNTFAANLEEVFENGRWLETSLEAERGIGRPPLTGRLLILPLSVDSEKPRMALGCLATQGRTGRGPRRFFVSGAKFGASSRLPPAPTKILTLVQGLAETPTAFIPDRATSGRPYLRLVKSDT